MENHNVSKAEQTRQLIIRKSASIFNKKGFAGTSLADLTMATGLTKGAIYGNFENKDAVALAVYDYNLDLITTQISAAITAEKHAADKLLAITNFYRSEYAAVLTAGGCPILNTAAEADDSHPALQQKAAQSIQTWKKSIEHIIGKGISRKEIDPQTDASEFATLCIALIEGGILLAKTTGNFNMLHTTLNHIDSLIDTKLRV